MGDAVGVNVGTEMIISSVCGGSSNALSTLGFCVGMCRSGCCPQLTMVMLMRIGRVKALIRRRMIFTVPPFVVAIQPISTMIARFSKIDLEVVRAWSVKVDNLEKFDTFRQEQMEKE